MTTLLSLVICMWGQVCFNSPRSRSFLALSRRSESSREMKATASLKSPAMTAAITSPPAPISAGLLELVEINLSICSIAESVVCTSPVIPAG